MNVRRPSFFGLFLLILTLCGSAAIVGVAPARADDVTEWNAIAIDVLALAGQNPVVMTRGLAMAHLAVHDALNAIDRRYEPYLYDARSEPGAAPGAAVAAAMHDVLVGALVGFGTERAAFRGLTPGERRTGQSAAPSDSLPGRDEPEGTSRGEHFRAVGRLAFQLPLRLESTNPQTRSVTMTAEAHSSETLRAQLAGSILLPSDAAYEDARRVHNGLIDRRPAMVARCHGTADVQAAVRFGRERGLELAVRGGGHNVAGHAVCDGGLMIDLSGMRAVHVDPRSRRARAQGGATWGDYNRETQLHGLASTGGIISSTGVGGLTLGGGLGWLMGKHGMAVDSLRAVEVVTATGEVLQASATEHPDLFWALRGGGGNFGIATWLEYELYPVGPMVIGGLVASVAARASLIAAWYQINSLAH